MDSPRPQGCLTKITILGLSTRTISGRFTGFFLGDVIDEFPRFHIEP